MAHYGDGKLQSVIQLILAYLRNGKSQNSANFGPPVITCNCYVIQVSLLKLHIFAFASSMYMPVFSCFVSSCFVLQSRPQTNGLYLAYEENNLDYLANGQMRCYPMCLFDRNKLKRVQSNESSGKSMHFLNLSFT